MISVEHMDELITRFKSGELDIRDIIEQSYFGGRADAIDEYFAKFDNWIKSDSKLSYFWTEFQVEARRIAEQLKSQDSME